MKSCRTCIKLHIKDSPCSRRPSKGERKGRTRFDWIKDVWYAWYEKDVNRKHKNFEEYLTATGEKCASWEKSSNWGEGENKIEL